MKIIYLLAAVVVVVGLAFAWFNLNTPELLLREASTSASIIAQEQGFASSGPLAATTTLDLRGEGLTSIAPDVFERTELTVLDLSENELSGTLQREIRELRALQVLDLSENQLTDVPGEVGELTQLRVLDLSGNPISGLPYELGHLINLEVLDLRGTDYSKRDLDIIKEGLPEDVEIRV